MASFAAGASTSALQQRPSTCAPCGVHLRSSRLLKAPQQANRLRCSSSAAGSLGGASPADPSGRAQQQQEQERTYKPFPRMRESDPYRLLGLSDDAEFEEVVSARNFLFEEYRWHEPSREAIELAFDTIIQEKLKVRNKVGFQAAGTRRRSAELKATSPSILQRLSGMMDPTVTLTTLINEGLVYVGLALWALFSTDQSFPLTGAFAYSVYKFQNKRVKASPEGPFFGGNPMIGALLSTLTTLAIGVGAAVLLTAPMVGMVEGSVRQLCGFIVTVIMGVLGVYLR